MSAFAPDKAVILAAGIGSRLRPLTDLRPKPMIEVNGTPVLHNALRNLEAVGVRQATIVVGYRKEIIQLSCGSRFGSVDIDYIESEVFDRTGSAYSLWLAREALMRGDTYLLEGDVFFEKDVLCYINRGEAPNVAAVAPFTSTMEGSAVVLTETGYIAEVRMKQTAENLSDGSPPLFKTMNLLRLGGRDLRHLIVPHLSEMINAGAVKSYTEELLSNLIRLSGLQIAAARCDDLKWCEIDNEADLNLAEAIFARTREVAC
ncbi:phosphocholine cytidylyltransferase family protein [Aliirhizobium smilacinae]|uniref:Phosphocholine cytidylyltransferase family protein n=1 Tax=Aliirhizobium smilacinae TaxID=1395944 RepID=A0A5C4XQW9_9HYPH|nr:phosphocholine cytidylyltransferase family protein [Rhizobium smilacinae]TNM65351.1 phosphocholine cytidylyltransferase family protein [Rhizobium smilacinae]